MSGSRGGVDRGRADGRRPVRTPWALSRGLVLAAVVGITGCGLLDGVTDESSPDPADGGGASEGASPPSADGAESAAAGQPVAAEEPAEPTGETFVLAVSDNNAFFAQVAAGAREVAVAEGVELIVVDAGEDPELQAEQLDIAAQLEVDGVIVNPVDSGDPAQSVAPVVAAGIPLVALDRAIEGVDADSYVASDNVDGGRQAAQVLSRLVGYDGLIVHLQGTAATSTSRERGQGFDEGLQDFPSVLVVARQTANFTRAEALAVTANILEAHPDVVGIFAEDDAMALGAVEALRGRAGAGVEVIGFNGTTSGLGAIVSGTMAATVAVNPEALGARGMEQAIATARGEDVDEVVPVPVEVVDLDGLLGQASS